MKRFLISASALLLMLLLGVGLAGPAYAEGTTPIAENLELTTYRNTAAGGCLAARDPDGDVVSYTITTQPVKGSVTVAEDGSFVYTPREGKKGRDYFGYRVTDAAGNVSQEATVLIRIERQKRAVFYEDMRGRAGEYAAQVLYEQGLFTGERLGGSYRFQPDRPITRGEFMQLCYAVADEPLLESVLRSGYADDAALSDTMRQLAATAAMQGVGFTRESFSPDSPLSKAEAACILSDILGLYSVDSAMEGLSGARQLQACMNLRSAGIIGESYDVEETLSREEAAIMLVKAMDRPAD